jgi:hypothetical protein
MALAHCILGKFLIHNIGLLQLKVSATGEYCRPEEFCM